MGVRLFRRGLILLAFVVLLIPAVTLLPPVRPATAAGTVGNGTPESCTADALRDAIDGGGLVTFNCGPAAVDIEFVFQKIVNTDTRIEGGGLVRLLASHDTRAFMVVDGATLEIDGMELVGIESEDGVLQGGAISVVEGDLIVTNSRVENHAAINSGGAISLNSETSATFDNVEFVGNIAQSEGGAIDMFNASLTVRNSYFAENSTPRNGGVMNIESTSTSFNTSIVNSTLVNNEAGGFGGAIHTFRFATLDISGSRFEANQSSEGGALRLLGRDTIISDSTFVDNRAENEDNADSRVQDGGAIGHSSGDLTITGSTFENNLAIKDGGAISHKSNDALEIVNSTFSGNSSEDQGAALFLMGTDVAITSSTITRTVSESIFGSAVHAAGPVRIGHTIIADNQVDSGCIHVPDWEFDSDGNNLTDDESCDFGASGDRLVEDVLLGELANNGGPTETHLPLSGSPAIDAGGSNCPVATDQRAISRPQGLGCEIGSVELVNQVDLCANRYNGDLRVPRNGCASTEIGLFLPEQAPLNVCVNRFNGDARYSRTGRCASTEVLIAVQGDGSQPVCVNRFNGDLRVPRSAGQCASTETATAI